MAQGSREDFFSVGIFGQSCQILREHGHLVEPVSWRSLRTLGKKWYTKKRRRKKRDKDAENQSQTTDVEEARINTLEHGDEARTTKEYCAYLLICASVA